MAPAEAVQESDTDAFPPLAANPVGGLAIVVPVASAEAMELPAASCATMVKKYCLPGVRLVRLAEAPLRPDSAAVVPSPPEVVASKMLYEVAPVLAVQARLREPAVVPGAATVTPVGAAGTVVTSTVFESGEITPLEETAVTAKTYSCPNCSPLTVVEVPVMPDCTGDDDTGPGAVPW